MVPMPDNIIQWMFAAYFALGSFGGFLFIAYYIASKVTQRNKYNPWEEMTRPVTEPVRSEPPISARRK